MYFLRDICINLFNSKVDTEKTMEQITKDTAIAKDTKAVVTKEEEEASQKAQLTQTMAEDAQRDLDEALPMLDAALASLKSLNKGDVTEVRTGGTTNNITSNASLN